MKQATCSSPWIIQDGKLFFISLCEQQRVVASNSVISQGSRETGEVLLKVSPDCAYWYSETYTKYLIYWGSSVNAGRCTFSSALPSIQHKFKVMNSPTVQGYRLRIHSSKHPRAVTLQAPTGKEAHVLVFSPIEKGKSRYWNERSSQQKGTKSHYVSHSFSPLLPHKHKIAPK